MLRRRNARDRLDGPEGEAGNGAPEAAVDAPDAVSPGDRAPEGTVDSPDGTVDSPGGTVDSSEVAVDSPEAGVATPAQAGAEVSTDDPGAHKSSQARGIRGRLVAIGRRLGLVGSDRWLARTVANPRTPLVLLGVVCVLGTGVRAFHLGIPAASHPNQGYIFDEHYYVSAARVIAGIKQNQGEAYYQASPKGTDPNAEHPQLGKIVIAAGMEVLGDNTSGWRITAVLFGAAAILLMYWLVRSAGGGSWLALGAAALAAGDNLWLVHSRIAVLDIYVVPFMLAGVGFYLRRRPVLAGIVIGIGCCFKEFGAYAVFVLLFFEAMRGLRWLWERHATRRAAVAAVTGEAVAGVTTEGDAAPAAGAAGAARAVGTDDLASATSPTTEPPRLMLSPPSKRPSIFRALLRPVVLVFVTGLSYFTLLTILDTTTTPYSSGHPVDRNQASICKYTLIWQDACNHFEFMNHYAARLKDNGHPTGIAAHPTEFWVNKVVIPYFKVTRTVTVSGAPPKNSTLIYFRGEISRVLLITAWFALLLNLWWAIRRRDDLSFLVIAWTLGTWLPPELFNLIGDRTTYLYYMVVAMPALYLAVARLLGAWRVTRWLIPPWALLFLYDAALLYPFRTLSGN